MTLFFGIVAFFALAVGVTYMLHKKSMEEA